MSSPEEIAQMIEKALHGPTAISWEFLYVDTYILFRAAMTPQRLRKNYEYRLELQNVSDNPRQLKLFAQAMRKTILERKRSCVIEWRPTWRFNPNAV